MSSPGTPQVRQAPECCAWRSDSALAEAAFRRRSSGDATRSFQAWQTAGSRSPPGGSKRSGPPPTAGHNPASISVSRTADSDMLAQVSRSCLGCVAECAQPPVLIVRMAAIRRLTTAADSQPALFLERCQRVYLRMCKNSSSDDQPREAVGVEVWAVGSRLDNHRHALQFVTAGLGQGAR